MIQLQKVCRFFTLGRETIKAVDNVSLEIKDGESIVIMGTSGSGKSTLMNLIGGLDRPNEGDVIVDGENIGKAHDHFLADYRNQKIGFVFQFFNLIPHYTVIENITFPMIWARIPNHERITKALTILKEVGLEKRAHQPTVQLSGGERQRVTIARALINDPKIILADEPTGNLDSKTGSEIVHLLNRLQKELKATLITVTHNAELAKTADRVIKIKDGQLTK